MKVFFWFYNVFLLLIISVLFNNFSITAIGIIGMLILYICLRGLKDVRYKDLTVIITLAFAFMLLLYAGLCEKYGEPYYASDDKVFEEYGHWIYGKNIFRFKDLPYIEGLFYAKGYLIVISWIERISNLLDGYSTVSPRILNLYLWISSAVLIYKQMDVSINNKPLVRKVFVALALFPNALYISSFVYRDVFIVFLIVVSIYNFEKLMKEVKNRDLTMISFIRIPVVLFCLNAIYYSRKQMLYVVMVIFLASFFEEKIKSGSSLKVAAIIAAGVVGAVLFYFTGGMQMLSVTSTGYSVYLQGLSDGLSGMVFSRPLLPIGVVLRFLYGLVCPFPAALLYLDYFGEPLYSLVIVLTCLGTVFQIFLLPYLFKGMIKLDYTAVKFLGMFAAIITTTFTFRHFIMAYPFAAVMLAQQIEVTEAKVRKKYAAYVVVLIMSAVTAYLLLKML